MTEKLEKFERLAARRVTETIKKMKLVGNLSNRRNYDYTEDHVKQIIDALENEIRTLKNRFREEATSDEYNFTFKQNKGEQQ